MNSIKNLCIKLYLEVKELFKSKDIMRISPGETELDYIPIPVRKMKAKSKVKKQLKTKKMKENYFKYWYKRFIKDGLKAMKLVIGLGLAVGLWYSVNLPIGIMFFGWVLIEALIDRN